MYIKKIEYDENSQTQKKTVTSDLLNFFYILNVYACLSVPGYV